jgi:hypothetical protein
MIQNVAPELVASKIGAMVRGLAHGTTAAASRGQGLTVYARSVTPDLSSSPSFRHDAELRRHKITR